VNKKMKKIYIIDVSEKNITGVTTYKNELFYCLNKIPNILLHNVILYSSISEFRIKKNKKIKQIDIPRIKGITIQKYTETLIYFFRLYIKDSSETFFFLNYSPSQYIVQELKKAYKSSKIIYVIHDFMWASFLLGNTKHLGDIIAKKNIRKENIFAFDSYKDGLISFNLVDKIVCLCQTTKDLLLEYYNINKDKITLINNGLRDSYKRIPEFQKKYLKNKLHIRDSCKIVLFVGRIRKQKGAYALLKCFESVVSAYADCILVMAGDFFSDDLIYVSNNIKSRIIFLGTIDKPNLNDWYKIADIGVVCSYYEQCSYSCIEMLMYGVPIIASDGFGLNSMFNMENALISKIENITDDEQFQQNIAESIIKLLSSDKIRKSLGKKSRKTYIKNYNIENMKNKYNQLISSLV